MFGLGCWSKEERRFRLAGITGTSSGRFRPIGITGILGIGFW